MRSKAKEPLTAEQESAFGAIGEAIEKAFTEDSIERKRQLDEALSKLGDIEEGKSVTSIIRGLAQRIDEVEAKSRQGFTALESFKLQRALEAKKDEIINVNAQQGSSMGIGVQGQACRLRHDDHFHRSDGSRSHQHRQRV